MEQELAGSHFPARYWHRLADGRIQCDVCPRFCKLHEGQRGLCFVRGRENDALVLTTYGRSSGFCVDPIEKKPLNHFLPGTPVLSFGTAGCNLTCKFCQNWDISKAREIDRLNDRADPAAIAAAAVQLGCRSVAFTYNDPVIFLEYAVDTAKACRAAGLAAVAVTAGYVAPEARREFFAHMDAANVDLKAFTEDFYRTGLRRPSRRGARHPRLPQARNQRLVRDHHPPDPRRERFRRRDRRTEPLGEDMRWVPTCHCISPRFTPTGKCATSRRPRPRPCRAPATIARANDVRHVYTGNVHDPAGGSTWCHGCGALLIGRDWFELTQWRLAEDGRCGDCGTQLAGVFEPRPGTWGRRRQPVRLRHAGA